MRTRIAALAGAAGLLACLAGAAPANATVTSSQVTVNTPPGTYVISEQSLSSNTMNITGSSNGTSGDHVDIKCFFGTTWNTLATNVPVAADGSFSFTGPFTSLQRATCVLRAVPSGDATDYPPGSPSSFSGPTLAIGAHREDTVASGSNVGTLDNYYVFASQLTGGMGYVGLGACGLADSYVYDPVTFAQGPYLLNCAAWFWWQNGSAGAQYAPATGSELQVDGLDAYLAGQIPYMDSTTFTPSGNPGFPGLSYSYAIDPATGNLTIDETDQVVICKPSPQVFPPVSSSCSSFAPSGVQARVHIVQDHDGRVSTITHWLSSTDGFAHQVSLLEDNEFGHPNKDGQFNFPWTGSGLQAYTTPGQVIPGPASAPGSFFVKGSASVPDGSETGSQGAVTYSTAPDSVRIVGPTNNSAGYSWIELAYKRTVPATGSLALGFSYAGAFLAGEVASDAAAAETAFRPTVAISSPASGTSTSQSPITVSGTAGDANGLSSLTVNGQSVTVAGNGTWSTSVPLHAGANTITATATNAFGNTSTATISVTYSPPATTSTTTTTPSSTSTLAPPILATIKFVLGGGAIPSPSGVSEKVTCHAPVGLTCRGLAQLTTLEKLLGSKITALSAKKPKRRTKRVLVGSTSFSLAGGKTRTIFVPLNATGRKLLARFGRLPVTLKISLLNTRPPTVLTAKTTIKPKKKKKRKKR